MRGYLSPNPSPPLLINDGGEGATLSRRLTSKVLVEATSLNAACRAPESHGELELQSVG